MAFLGISRPALVCLLLWLTVSREAAQERRKAKCKDPKVKIIKKKICLALLVRDTKEILDMKAATSTLVSRPQKNLVSGLKVQRWKSRKNDQSPFY